MRKWHFLRMFIKSWRIENVNMACWIVAGSLMEDYNPTQAFALTASSRSGQSASAQEVQPEDISTLGGRTRSSD